MKLIQIGIIHSPYKEASGTPIQPVYSSDLEGDVEVFPEFAEGLSDIDGFERIWLIFGADRARPFRLKVVPYRDTVEHGVFATRSPSRPNSILISPVRLLGHSGNHLRVSEMDILNGSPLYDIKPYIAKVDAFPNAKGGWFHDLKDSESEEVSEADNRFSK